MDDIFSTPIHACHAPGRQRAGTTSSLITVSSKSLISRDLFETKATTSAFFQTAWPSAFSKAETSSLFQEQWGPPSPCLFGRLRPPILHPWSLPHSHLSLSEFQRRAVRFSTKPSKASPGLAGGVCLGGFFAPSSFFRTSCTFIFSFFLSIRVRNTALPLLVDPCWTYNA